MDYIEQISSIQYLVNNAQSVDEARMKYLAMDALFLDRFTADSVFEEALRKKFTEKQASILSEIESLNSKLK
jgi:hypothetical protein